MQSIASSMAISFSFRKTISVISVISVGRIKPALSESPIFLLQIFRQRLSLTTPQASQVPSCGSYDIKLMTRTEVNPESWTQLKGSNETNF